MTPRQDWVLAMGVLAIIAMVLIWHTLAAALLALAAMVALAIWQMRT